MVKHYDLVCACINRLEFSEDALDVVEGLQLVGRSVDHVASVAGDYRGYSFSRASLPWAGATGSHIMMVDDLGELRGSSPRFPRPRVTMSRMKASIMLFFRRASTTTLVISSFDSAALILFLLRPSSFRSFRLGK